MYFSTTGMMLRPIFWASIAISMNSSSLKPLQMIGVSLSASADDGQQLRLGAGLEAEVVRRAEVEHLLDDLPLLVDLDRVDAAVAALVLVLGDRRLEGVVDLADPVAEDVGEADQDRQLDAAELQVVDQLLQVDGAGRILRRVDEHVARRGDGEVALAPAVDLVELGGVGDGEDLSRLPVAVTPRRGCAHAIMIRQLPYICSVGVGGNFALEGRIAVDPVTRRAVRVDESTTPPSRTA